MPEFTLGLAHVIIKFYSGKHNKNNNNIMRVHRIVIHVYKKFVTLLNNNGVIVVCFVIKAEEEINYCKSDSNETVVS